MEEHNYSVSDFCFYFAEAYINLHERGLLTKEQLERISNLLDMMEVLPPELFQERLQRIFTAQRES